MKTVVEEEEEATGWKSKEFKQQKANRKLWREEIICNTFMAEISDCLIKWKCYYVLYESRL